MDVRETRIWGKMYIKYVRRREEKTDKNIQSYKGNTIQSKERRTERKTKKKD
jgi:hypothetical protein